MSTNQAGRAVRTGLDKRRTLRIFRLQQLTLVGEVPIMSMGINADTARQNRVDFANVLLHLGNQLAQRPRPQLPDVLPQPADAGAGIADQVLEILRPNLELEEDTAHDYLDRLRLLGAPLYADLSKPMKQALAQYKVWAQEEDTSDDPSLTFVLSEGDDETKAPILWPMLYQGDQADWPPDWRKFWGFRLPITQWLTEIPRDEAIQVDSTLSVIDERLYFPRYEMLALQSNLAHARHQQFGEVVRKLVEAELGRRMSGDEMAAWWAANQSPQPAWLQRFLAELTDVEAQRARRAEIWKRQALKSVFVQQQPYSLIHFACHCVPDQNDLLSKLDIHLAGEGITLNSAFVDTDLGRSDEWDFDDPGPIIFLNACATGQQPDGDQVPAFPVQWIRRQGAKAVIVTICHVPDTFAYAFALKFYDILFSALRSEPGRTLQVTPDLYVAEALLKTRKYFMERFNNPLGLAYDLYAVGDAHVQPGLSGGETA